MAKKKRMTSHKRAKKVTFDRLRTFKEREQLIWILLCVLLVTSWLWWWGSR